MVKKLSLVIPLVGLFTGICAQEKQLPNIIYILADDLGRGLISANGQDIISTPNIDRLAVEGMQFTHAYSQAYCLPSRASLLTGLHDCHSNGWSEVKGGDWILYVEEKITFDEVINKINKAHFKIPDEEVFLPQLLQQAGYTTAQVGKLEWGFSTTPYRLKRHGWDYHFGYYDHRMCHGFYPRMLFENGKEIWYKGNPSADAKTKGSHYSQEIFLEKMLAFLRAQADIKKPFFLYHPSQIPHGDIMIPEIHVDFINDERLTTNQKTYASMVKMLDDHIGVLLDELEKLNMSNNTIVIFSSDNGHEIYYELSHQKCYSGNGIDSDRFDTEIDGDVFNGNWNLTGKKFSMWEGGTRIPLIVKWPGETKSGSQSNLLVALYDLMPTLAEIAGVSMPEGKDGVSFAPTLKGLSQVEHDFVISKGRVRDTKHYGAALVTKDGWKLRYILEKSGNDIPDKEVYQLYMLDEDPKEKVNLASKLPVKLD